MLIKKAPEMRYSDVTPLNLYLRRREFIRMASGVALAGLSLSKTALARRGTVSASAAQDGKLTGVRKGPFGTSEERTPLKDVTAYNNFYEFGAEKDDPARNAGSLRPRPWTIKVEGALNKPGQYGIDDFIKPHALEERIYRLRCVEAWSMVIPWVGIPLADVIKRFEPTSKARFVEFTTLYDPKQMPGQRRDILPWPYVEGLRMDEAMHPLAILSVGLYGQVLPNQNGAPLRLVVPWKYGFKSIKSIVRIRFVEKQPLNTWQEMQAGEYGFYANVNPEVDHPRWSQASERRIGEFFRRKTLMFNGYADQVSSLYAGMNLRKNY